MANENAIVNTAPTVSETPSDLVAEKENELSPNPAGFGFTKQVTVNSLSSPGAPNVLYLVPQYDGEGRVKEYYRYKWNVYKSAFERIFEPVNNVSYEKGEHATPVVENTAPSKAPEKIYNGPVAFNDDIFYKGKKLPEEDEVGSIVKPNPTLAGTEAELTGIDIDGTKFKVVSSTDVTAAINEAIYGAIDASY